MAEASASEDDEYWTLYSEVVESHGRVLAALETLRRDCLERGSPVGAWALAIVERMLCEFEFGTTEHSRVHNVAARAFTGGIGAVTPPPAAAVAFNVHAGDFRPGDTRDG